MIRSRLFALAAATATLACGASSAWADVVSKAENGFVLRGSSEVPASPSDVWKVLVVPSSWWSKEHTFSGDAANLTIDPVPGGCFCERLPVPKGAPAGQKPGGVQHMRVIYVDPGHALRLSGALGPLQSEALVGTLTILVKPAGERTRIQWDYVVGGYIRFKVDELAPGVDRVLTEQMGTLAEKLGGAKLSAAPAAAPVPASAGRAAAAEKPGPPAGPGEGEAAARESSKAAFDAAIGTGTKARPQLQPRPAPKPKPRIAPKPVPTVEPR
ncbi:SRPBCC family protein [Novosphingobium lentum]|uniref:SRPBCC family protein n=1 Tax=Novosphingobium lentum TaxID=145287 RepID=UPI000A852097|nr:SRPBCC family protein [Novosphingobium lentum]